jgi:hypothetical protein
MLYIKIAGKCLTQLWGSERGNVLSICPHFDLKLMEMKHVFGNSR